MNQARMRMARNSELSTKRQNEKNKQIQFEQERLEYIKKTETLFKELEQLKQDYEEAIAEAHAQRDNYYQLIIDFKAERDALFQ